MLYERVHKFLDGQKRRMVELDAVSGISDRERNGFDFSMRDKVTGAHKGLREILYENTILWLESQSSPDAMFGRDFEILDKPGNISEDTLTTSFTSFITSLLPAVRRIYSNLIAMDLVSVQPLPGPSGYIYYLDHQYGTTYAGEGITAGDRMDQSRPRGYSDSSEKGAIREVNFEVSKVLVETTIKKLKALWTMEAEQDLRAQWKLNLESEIMPEVTNEIIREIDAEIIYALVAGVGAGNVNWNKNGYLAGDTTTGDRRAYRETLYEAIVEANALIFAKKYRSADFILCDGDTYARLEKLENFKSEPVKNQLGQIGRYLAGTLAGRYKVYVDPWFYSDFMVMGVRGATWKDAVAYYAPYIPLFTSEKYIIEDDFTRFARGAMTRYAKGVIPESEDVSTNYGLASITITSS